MPAVEMRLLMPDFKGFIFNVTNVHAIYHHQGHIDKGVEHILIK